MVGYAQGVPPCTRTSREVAGGDLCSKEPDLLGGPPNPPTSVGGFCQRKHPTTRKSPWPCKVESQEILPPPRQSGPQSHIPSWVSWHTGQMGKVLPHSLHPRLFPRGREEGRQVPAFPHMYSLGDGSL